MITLQQAPALFQQIVDCPPHELSDAIYEQRVQLLMERLRRCGLTHAVIYGDREHFSHMEYFTKYDCRFEEGLFILSEDGARYLVIGNEGMGFSAIVPYAVTRHLYQNFSLQGQPRGASKGRRTPLPTAPDQAGYETPRIWKQTALAHGNRLFNGSAAGSQRHTLPCTQKTCA